MEAASNSTGVFPWTKGNERKKWPPAKSTATQNNRLAQGESKK